ncbi:hypothetical protein [Halomarina rubra]|uniref:RDD family protein n=1 Tax=Halomarina rubra TaxID=2071873 RepID=A0ABD6AWR5_9EURY|nr:hypothetical protein [Halomarina rubra]
MAGSRRSVWGIVRSRPRAMAVFAVLAGAVELLAIAGVVALEPLVSGITDGVLETRTGLVVQVVEIGAVAVLAELLWFVVGPALAAGGYGLVRSNTAAVQTTPATLRVLVRSVISDYRSLARTRLLQRVAALPLVVVSVVPVCALAFALLTGVEATAYALAPTSQERTGRNVLGVVVLFSLFVAWGVGRAPFGFVDLLVLDGRSAREAIRESVRATLSDGRAILARFVILLLGLCPLVVGTFVALQFYGLGPWQFVGIVAATSAVVRPLAILAHLRTYRRFVGEPTRDVTGTASVRTQLRRHVPRFALAGLFVSALLVGTVAVRTVDVRPYEATTTDVSPDADAVVLFEAGRTALGRESHTAAARVTNTTSGRQMSVCTSDINYRQRRGTAHFTFGDDAGRAYLQEGVFAQRNDYTQSKWLVERSDPDDLGWFRCPTTLRLPAGDEPWRVAERTDENVTLELTDPVAIRNATTVDLRNSMVADGPNRIVATFDRDTGRLLAVDETLNFVLREDGNVTDQTRTHTELRFSGYESTTVERPESLGDPGLRERLLDVLYY